jgi:hypothetical protein
LSQLDIQLVTARSAGFFPTLQADLSTDADRGLKMGAAALFKAQSARDALPALPPIGFGGRDAEFDKVFMDTFHLIVLRGHNPRVVLDQEAEVLRRLMAEVGAPYWEPGPPGVGGCHVRWRDRCSGEDDVFDADAFAFERKMSTILRPAYPTASRGAGLAASNRSRIRCGGCLPAAAHVTRL